MCIVVSMHTPKNSKLNNCINFLGVSTNNLCRLKVLEKHKSKYMTPLYNLMFAQQQDAGRKHIINQTRAALKNTGTAIYNNNSFLSSQFLRTFKNVSFSCYIVTFKTQIKVSPPTSKTFNRLFM